ncbi:family 78 glycoside hydrolase catalytic domain [Lacisediminihabitans sp. FW035]
MTDVIVAAPTFEHHREAFGIGEARPRVSWKTAAPAGWVQDRYQLELVRGETRLRSELRDSAESVLVDWPFASLESRQRAQVRVRCWGADGQPSAWSAPATVEAGLLASGDWVASAVGPALVPESRSETAPWLIRAGFSLHRPIVSARLYATAHGNFEAEINGRRVGDETLAPGWTSYSHRLRYRTYDVTDLLSPGANAIGAHLADGWYRGRLGFHGGHTDLYGDDVALLAQLEVTLDDGSVVVVATDESWRVARGPIRRASLLEGERYDARLEVPGWSEPGFADSTWQGAVGFDLDPQTLVAPTGPPVRCTQELPPLTVTTSPRGASILDFGQNLVGRLRIRVRGEAGTRLRLRHAEILQDGELETRPLRGATATDEYVLRGDTDGEEWEPRFTLHGFRYAEITGWTGGPIADNVVARVYHSDLERTGYFECSDGLLNRLHENVVWSMRGNFVDIPTDCPQRDERLGWTGDLQVFAPTASFLFDCSGMLVSWLADVAAEQLPDGTVPWFVPSIPGGEMWTPARPGAGWGDVVALTPVVLYEHFGDERILADQFDSARRWVDLIGSLVGSDGVWDSGFQLGDWLDPSAPPDDPAAGLTDRYLVASAYLVRSTEAVARMASLLGLQAEADLYGTRAAEATRAFADRYIGSDGRLLDESQAAYALAIVFGLFATEAHRVAAGARLAELVIAGGSTIATGFLGTPVLLDALSSTGNRDTAYGMLTQTRCPGWLYPVTMGATTVWERWDSLLPDGTVNPGEMTSFNHFAFGAVADWMHREVAGIRPIDPGYRTIGFRPNPGGGITSAHASLETPYGPAAIDWRVENGLMSVQVVVPTGARAIVQLPDGARHDIGPGAAGFACVISEIELDTGVSTHD